MTHDGPQSATMPESSGATKRRKPEKRELRVVFDTNVLYTGSASDLLRQEAATLIAQSIFPDLEVTWYLPEVVRHERQYQMQKRALELLSSVAKLERLLGHNLNITDAMLIEQVQRAAQKRQTELRLVPLKLDYGRVDWDRLVLDAVYRRPPFEEGQTEKGFRDALVVESFMQLAADSPRSAKVCRLILVTDDGLVTEAAQSRIASLTNTRVVPSLEELKGPINTLASEVEESFIAALKPRAEKLFFVPKDETTLYYKEHVRDRLRDKFKKELSALPPGATRRTNGTWRISPPNFDKKARQRVFWRSSIQIEAEAAKTVSGGPQVTFPEEPGIRLGAMSEHGWLGALLSHGSSPTVSIEPPSSLPIVVGRGSHSWDPASSPIPGSLESISRILAQAPSTRSITTHKGVDKFEVLWSVDVTVKRGFRRQSIDDVRHVEAVWEPVS